MVSVGLQIKAAKFSSISPRRNIEVFAVALNDEDVISAEGAVDVKTEIELDFQKNPFYKNDIAENQGCLVSVG